MVVKEDGSKWACHTCLLGHRVSGCDHTDRELFPVLKKGRPVSQCQHCRTERKGRSAHVKCECGAKPFPKERCFYMNKARSRFTQSTASAATAVGDYTLSKHSTSLVTTSLPDNRSMNEQHCCCPHGGKCICTGPQKEQHKGNDTNLMKDLYTSGPHMPGERRSATPESEARAKVSVGSRHKSLQPASSTHGQLRLPFGPGPSYQKNIYDEQTMASPLGENLAHVQDRSQARHHSPFPNIDNPTLDLTLPGQDSPHFLYDFHDSSLPSWDEMASSSNTFTGLPDQTHQEYGSSIIPTILPNTAVSDVPSALSYPTAWSSVSPPVDQWQAVDWTRYANLDWTHSGIMSATMSGLFGGDDPLVIEDTSWPHLADVQENIDPEPQVGFNSVPSRQSRAGGGTTRDVESDDERRMPVQSS